jgi:hypothetical protein
VHAQLLELLHGIVHLFAVGAHFQRERHAPQSIGRIALQDKRPLALHRIRHHNFIEWLVAGIGQHHIAPGVHI